MTNTNEKPTENTNEKPNAEPVSPTRAESPAGQISNLHTNAPQVTAPSSRDERGVGYTDNHRACARPAGTNSGTLTGTGETAPGASSGGGGRSLPTRPGGPARGWLSYRDRDADPLDMTIISDTDSTAGEWVRLEFHGAVIDLARWPGPIGPDHPIISVGGCFEFDHTDTNVEGAPENVYRWHPS